MMLAATLFFTVTALTVYGQDSPLKVDIKTTQAVVRNVRDFDISTKIENVGKEEQLLHLSQCSYSGLQWTADNASVHVKQIFCKKNRLIDIRLRPGEAYERALPVRIEIPVLGLPQPVTFRLGFSPWDGAVLVGSHPTPTPPSAPVPPIWSNAVTVTVK
jgi:hypothetical protein